MIYKQHRNLNTRETVDVYNVISPSFGIKNGIKIISNIYRDTGQNQKRMVINKNSYWSVFYGDR